MRYQVGGKITVDGVEYEIDDVQIEASAEGGRTRVAYTVRTKPGPEVIEVTITEWVEVPVEFEFERIPAETCGDAWEDEDSFGIGHECRLPKGHSGDHICANQDDDQDFCHWHNWDY